MCGRILPAQVLALVVLAACGGKDRADAAAVEPLDPAQKNFGMSNDEWGTVWWQWIFSSTASSLPYADATGASCQNGQTHAVFFLAGAQGSAERDCTVPKDKPLFFPLVNLEVDNEGLPLEERFASDADARKFVDDVMTSMHDEFASLDGRAFGNIEAYRGHPTTFAYDLNAAEPAVTPAEGQSLHVDGAISNGFWMMLPPLSAGDHLLHFGGQMVFGQPFTNDVTYHLHVK